MFGPVCNVLTLIFNISVIVLGTSHVFRCLSISRQDLRTGFSDLDRYL